MYNEELKKRFIKEQTNNKNTADVYIEFFNATQKYEKDYQQDICTFTLEQFQEVFEKLFGLRARSQQTRLSRFKSYLRWCVWNEIPGVNERLLEVKYKVDPLDKIRAGMIGSPQELQKFLDIVFYKEEEDTIENVYRCYLWLAFNGISEKDVSFLKISDINFDDMIITDRNDLKVPIYKEELLVIQKCVKLKHFQFYHTNPDYIISRDRIPGDSLLRGIKKDINLGTINSVVSRKVAQAIKEGKTNLNLNFSKIYLSGVFYKVYQSELNGNKIDFSNESLKQMNTQQYQSNEENYLEFRKSVLDKFFESDYYRWKKVFYP